MHNCVVRNKAAEVCEKYLKKGDKVYIEGRIKNRQWTGEDGQQRYTTEIQVQEFTFLTPKGENAAPTQQQSQRPVQPQQVSRPAQPQQQANQSYQGAPAPASSDDDDDLPF